MALKTLGTAATTTLAAMAYQHGANVADLASIAANIKSPNAANGLTPGHFLQNGYLRVPGRGNLWVQPGDWIAYDDKGWPILISSYSILNGSAWQHS